MTTNLFPPAYNDLYVADVDYGDDYFDIHCVRAASKSEAIAEARQLASNSAEIQSISVEPLTSFQDTIGRSTLEAVCEYAIAHFDTTLLTHALSVQPAYQGVRLTIKSLEFNNLEAFGLLLNHTPPRTSESLILLARKVGRSGKKEFVEHLMLEMIDNSLFDVGNIVVGAAGGGRTEMIDLLAHVCCVEELHNTLIAHPYLSFKEEIGCLSEWLNIQQRQRLLREMPDKPQLKPHKI